ncbi:aminotransferase class IV [Spirosoma sp. 209]|uniref:aminotransferase class IV n=1 Tax=Spirosoma sp. 209 TaxID=1955701 RepID=UPI00098D513F|nr:aminotransferase class IV [Spirosoma sp. 209]
MFLVYNSDLLAEDAFLLTANDRAFQYGDGLFETIRYEAGQLWFWDDHLSRLTAGMAALHLLAPAAAWSETLQQRVLALLAANGLTQASARVRIQVWRQTGGLYTPTTNQLNLLITARPGQPFAITNQAKIGIYPDIQLAYSPISGYKTSNALPYVLAGLFKQEQGYQDAILLDQQGHLAECVASNLFWFRQDVLHTPSLQTGCINGIARRQLLRAFPMVREGLFLPASLAEAELVFTANVMGIQVYKGRLSETLQARLLTLFSPA